MNRLLVYFPYDIDAWELDEEIVQVRLVVKANRNRAKTK